MAGAFQLGVEEAQVELGIVDHELCIAQERQEFVGLVGEQGLVGEEFVGVIFRDEEDGELSYNFSMAILDFDLED